MASLDVSMDRILALLTVCVLAGATACGATSSSPDAAVGGRDGAESRAGGDGADGQGDTVDARLPEEAPADRLADVVADRDGDATRATSDAGVEADPPNDGSGPADAAVDAREIARDARADAGQAADTREAGRDAAGAADAAADTPEVGREAGAGADAAVDARDSGRDAGGAERRDGADALPDTATAPDAGGFLVRGASRKWHVTSTVTIDNQNATLTGLAVVLPAPQTNIYQDVANLAPGAGTLLAIPDTDDFYLRFAPSAGLPGPGARASYAVSYDVTLYELSIDFTKVTTLPPYDTTAPDYVRYTGPRGVYVDPDHPTIVAIAASLGAGSPDVLAYAKAAYEHVASRYQYLNPNTGLHPLGEILAAGGGDCGNLASIFVSLLRHRGIPARHLVAIRPDGSYHVWADFLLPGYGWVPVDVTYKHDNPAGDYFGKVALASNGIIMDKQVWLTLDLGGSTTEVDLLQTYAWWFWTSTSSASVTTSYALAATAR
ncbi:MAG: hypothetical protein JXP73_08470 [Deltaproteobacteria bacterium]|nr:hypothetical protein [Deltaproteobacteria bacterium]